tara:strand:+ start:157 stop:492 length:336 start_codon:yes stop_codon:yes gene_type:complete
MKFSKELKETIKNDERFDMQEMISLKSLVKYVKEAKITPPKKGVETPLDAKVQIPGFGVMTRKQMQGSIQRYIKEVMSYIKKGDVESAYNALYKRGVLKGFLETEVKHSGK